MAAKTTKNAKKPAPKAKKPAAKKVAPKKVAKPVAKKAVKVPAKKVAKPVKKVAAKKVAKPAKKAVAKKVVKPVAKKAAKPVKSVAPKKVTKPVAKKPVAKAPLKPAAKVAPRAAPVKAAPVAAKPTKAESKPGKPALVSARPAPTPVNLGPKPELKLVKAVLAAPKDEGPKPATPEVKVKMAAAKPLPLGKGVSYPKDYVPTEDEPYMNAKQLAYFRDRLYEWRRQLEVESLETVKELQEHSAIVSDLNDQASLEYEQAVELRTRDRERKLIQKIDEALERITDGSYGFCVETGDPIGIPRLLARPIATLCIEAKRMQEKKEKEYAG